MIADMPLRIAYAMRCASLRDALVLPGGRPEVVAAAVGTGHAVDVLDQAERFSGMAPAVQHAFLSGDTVLDAPVPVHLQLVDVDGLCFFTFPS